MRKAVVLLSGGLDSTTVLAHAKSQGFEPFALSFRYGQRHVVELEAAKRVAEAQGVAGHVVATSTSGCSAAPLSRPMSMCRSTRASDTVEESIPVTYVPARNTVFLSFALAYAEVIGATDIFIGVNALDYSGYPDCRPSTSPPTRTWRTSPRGQALRVDA